MEKGLRVISLMGLLVLTSFAQGQTVDFSFSIDPTSCGGTGNSIQFTNLSSTTYTDFEWWFGDGNTSTLMNPLYHYPQVGTYTVYLFASNATTGDFVEKTVTLTASLNLAQNINVISMCPCNDFQFQAVGTATSWSWDFGDGNTATGVNVTHVYNHPGNYEVQLTGSSGSCSQTKSEFIEVCPADIQYSRSDDNWVISGFFGHSNDVLLNFNSGIGLASTLPRNFSPPPESVSTYSDPFTGNLLFYCSGDTVYNALFQPMPNGHLMTGHWSSGQTSLIIPKPGYQDQFFIFTSHGATADGLGLGYHYHEVDMTLNSGLGDVISKDNLLSDTDCPSLGFSTKVYTPHEAISATRRSQCAGDDNYWVVVPDCAGRFKAFLIDENGINPPITSSFQVNTSYAYQNEIGTSCFSPNGKKYAVAEFMNSGTTYSPMVHEFNNRIAIFDFDKATGRLSNPTYVPVTNARAASLDFSADGSKFYANSSNSASPTSLLDLNQFDMESHDLIGSKSIVPLTPTGATYYSNRFGLGPDGRLYVPSNPSRIDNPNDLVPSLSYSPSGFISGIFHPKSNVRSQIIKEKTELDVLVSSTSCNLSFENNTLSPIIPTDPCSFYADDTLVFDWDMGDGTTYAGSVSPSHTYAADGNYDIVVEMYRDKICQFERDTFQVSITGCASVLTASYIRDKDTVCIGDTVTYLDNSTGTTSGATYTWSFGVGAIPPTASGPGPHQVVYTAGGTPSAQLTVTDGILMDDTTSTLTVHGTPAVAATNTGPYCEGGVIEVFSGASGSSTVNWTGPNSFTSGLSDPTIASGTLGMAGYYSVKVEENGCTTEDSTLVDITSCTVLIAAFTRDIDTICVGDTVTYSDVSTGTTGSATYAWAFGTGAIPPTATCPGPHQVVYATLGTPSVQLTVTDGTLTHDTTRTITVHDYPTVTVGNTGPYCESDLISLTSTSIATLNGWTGPNSFTSTLANPTIPGATISMSGYYTVAVEANGCVTEDSTLVTVNNCANLTASYTRDKNEVCIGDTITYADASTGSNPITSHTWSFGLGATPVTATGPGPHQVVYGTAGTPSTQLTVTDGTLTDDTIRTITVHNYPTVTVGNSGPYCESDLISLTSSSTATLNGWTGPNAFTSTLANPTIPGASLSMSGYYTIAVEANGCVTEDSTLVTVNNCATLTASYTRDKNEVCIGDTVTYMDASTGSNPITNHTWNFGLGATPATATGPGPHQVVYTTAGTPSIQLTVSDGTLTDDTTSAITVHDFPTVTVGNTGPYCESDLISLTSSSTATLNGWTGPNAFTSTLANPTIPGATIGMSGYYTVAVEANGCVTEDSTLVTVLNCTVLTAVYTRDKDEICVGDTVTYTDASLNTSVSSTYAWSFGTGATPATATGPGPHRVIYGTAGTPSSQLTVTEAGLSDDTVSTITVHEFPVVSSTTSGPYCEGDLISLTSTSTATLIGWTGPYGFINSLTNPTIPGATLAMSGYYTVEVEENGCISEDSTSVVVIPSVTPSAVIASDTNAICEGTPVNFNITSMAEEGGTPSFTWLVNGVSSRLGPTFSSVNLEDGDEVTVELTSTAKCALPVTVLSNVIEMEVYEFMTPSVMISADSLPACIGDEVHFVATPGSGTQGSLTYAWDVNHVATGTTGQSYSNSALVDGDVVSVLLTTDYPCPRATTALDSVVAAIEEVPTPSILESDQSFCSDDFPGVQLNAVPSQSNTTLVWKNQDGEILGTGTTVEVLAAGIFILEEDNEVCPPGTSSPMRLQIHESPQVEAGQFQMTQLNEVTSLSGSATEAPSVVWSSQQTNVALVLSDGGILAPEYTPGNDTATGYIYFVLTAYNEDCSASDSVLIFVQPDLEIPNTFTPNADEINDTWELKGLESFPNHRLQIFNRWGNLVYEGRGNQPWWDGTRNRYALPTATYYYVLKLGITTDDSDVRSGDVTIVR